MMVLNGAHTVISSLGESFTGRSMGQSLGFVTGVTMMYPVIGIELWFSRRGSVGPPFWTIIGCAGWVVGWCSHFSPVTDQPVPVIYGAYHTAAEGAVAVACLMRLMSVVLAMTVYSAYFWYHYRSGRHRFLSAGNLSVRASIRSWPRRFPSFS